MKKAFGFRLKKTGRRVDAPPPLFAELLLRDGRLRKHGGALLDHAAHVAGDRDDRLVVLLLGGDAEVLDARNDLALDAEDFLAAERRSLRKREGGGVRVAACGAAFLGLRFNC